MASQTIQEYIWKQWKKPRIKLGNLVKLGNPEYFDKISANSRKSYWFMTETSTVKRAISNERLMRAGYFDLSEAYGRIQAACIGCAVCRTVRTVR